MNLDKSGISRKKREMFKYIQIVKIYPNFKQKERNFKCVRLISVWAILSAIKYLLSLKRMGAGLPLHILEFRILSKCSTLPSTSFQDDLKSIQHQLIFSESKYHIYPESNFPPMASALFP